MKVSADTIKKFKTISKEIDCERGHSSKLCILGKNSQEIIDEVIILEPDREKGEYSPGCAYSPGAISSVITRGYLELIKLRKEFGGFALIQGHYRGREVKAYRELNGVWPCGLGNLPSVFNDAPIIVTSPAETDVFMGSKKLTITVV